MMSLVQLEIFDCDLENQPPQTMVVPTAALEQARAEAYELGYAAGQEDATFAAHSQRQAQEQEILNCLNKLHESDQSAQDMILAALQPVLIDLLKKILPLLAQKSLVPRVSYELLAMLDPPARSPIKIVMSQENCTLMQVYASQLGEMHISVDEDASLGQGQAYLKKDHHEYRIDLDTAVAAIIRLVEDYFSYAFKEKRDG